MIPDKGWIFTDEAPIIAAVHFLTVNQLHKIYNPSEFEVRDACDEHGLDANEVLSIIYKDSGTGARELMIDVEKFKAANSQ